MNRLVCAAAAAVLSAVLSPSALAACYVVYGADKDIIYRDVHAPVDLSRQLHETVPAVAPGATLVFTPDIGGCESPIHNLPVGLSQAAAGAPAPAGEGTVRAPRGDRG